MTSRPLLLIVIAAVLAVVAWHPASAAGGSALGQPSAPGVIVIDAAQAIEWSRKARSVTARGEARAVRGDQEVRADVLTARYRERPDGSTEVWRLDANGNVRFTSASASGFGEHAVFNADDHLITLTGGEQVGVTTPTSRITAETQMEYYTETKTLIARGNAVAVDGDRTLQGEVITVRLREQENGPPILQRLEAEGDVHLTTPGEEIGADRGTYDPERGMATLDGAVRIVRGNNELQGCRAEMDLNSGVSKLLACAGPTADARVRGVILPESLKKQ